MSTILYGKSHINYELIFEQRQSLQVAVYPDSTVIVKAPDTASIMEVEKKLKRRARWICKQQHYFNQFSPLTPPRSFVSGETHLYLGRQYRLMVTSEGENKVKLIDGKFMVFCKSDSSPGYVRSHMEKWYKEKAEIIYQKRFEVCWKQFGRFDIQRPKIAIRKLKTRWGSLSRQGRLTLNANLIKAPTACIDYVITHELCHLIYPHHDSRFYRLLDAKMPAWTELKNRLEQTLS